MNLWQDRVKIVRLWEGKGIPPFRVFLKPHVSLVKNTSILNKICCEDGLSEHNIASIKNVKIGQ